MSPSPRPLSLSLLVIDSRAITGALPLGSDAVMVAVTVTSLWLGGHRSAGLTLTEIVGGAAATCTVTVDVLAADWLPALSVATNDQVVVPSGKIVPAAPVVGFVMWLTPEPAAPLVKFGSLAVA